MDARKKVLKELVQLSNNLGKPRYNLAIIGEGNTSAQADADSFYIKASGTELRTIREDGFVLLSIEKILDLLKLEKPDDNEIKRIFEGAKLDKTQGGRPSVETLLHALCLSYDGVNFVGHTHPVAINMLACAKGFPDNLKGRMYPDEIVFLGRDSVFIPYTDPGVVLAKKVKQEIDAYIRHYGEIPKAIYMQNHGFLAPGSTALEVENITLTASKAAEIRIGALSCGGINLLSAEIVKHIAGRPDEKYRQQIFEGERHE